MRDARAKKHKAHRCERDLATLALLEEILGGPGSVLQVSLTLGASAYVAL